MKKKGLIISTIVMVVVLIASLTTATYAWFSSSASAQLDTINLNVQAASDVAIGLYKAGETTSQASYVSGTVTYTNNGTNLWTGSAGLGTTLSTGINLNVSAGVGSAHTAGAYQYIAVTTAQLRDGYTESEPNVTASIEQVENNWVWKSDAYSWIDANLYLFDTDYRLVVHGTDAYSGSATYFVRKSAAAQMDAAYTRANPLYKASGDTFATLGLPEAATINSNQPAGSDVLDLQMAIKPVKTEVYGTYCVITINPTSEFVGMAAALWADISIGSTQYTVVDLFDMGESADVHYDTTTPTTEGFEGYKFYFPIDTFRTTQMTANGSTVTPFSIRLFVSGYDEDCISSATGTGATIDIQFYGTAKDNTEASYTHATGAQLIPLVEA